MRFAPLAAAVAATASLALTSAAFGQTLQVELGVRETGTTAAIGGDGGTSGTVELVGGGTTADPGTGKMLTLNSGFQTFTYTFGGASGDPVRGFTGNGVLAGGGATIENLWIDATNNVPSNAPVTLFIDDISFFDASEGTTTFIEGFESATVGQEVRFQEPGFASTTTRGLVGSTGSGVTAAAAATGSQSYGLSFTLDSDPTTDTRLRIATTSGGGLISPNTAIRIDPGDQVSFKLAGIVPEPTSMAALGLAGLGMLRRRR